MSGDEAIVQEGGAANVVMRRAERGTPRQCLFDVSTG